MNQIVQTEAPSETVGIVFTGAQAAELAPMPLAPFGPRSLLVRSLCSLISTGTETIAFARRFDPGTHWDRWVRYPFPAGYSLVGVVEAVGPEVDAFKPGDRVASLSHHMRHVVIEDRDAIRIPAAVGDRDAAWFALSYVAQNGVRGADIQLGDDVAVIGLGPVGQLAAQFARCSGAARIIAIDASTERVGIAIAHGATYAVPAGAAEAEERVQSITCGRGCDVVIDTTGNEQVLLTAMRLARRRGTVAIIGDTGSPSGQRMAPEAMTKSLRFVFTHGTCTPPVASEWSRWTRLAMVDLFFLLLQDGRMRVASLNSHVFDPRDCQAAYRRLVAERAATMGCHFAWSQP